MEHKILTLKKYPVTAALLILMIMAFSACEKVVTEVDPPSVEQEFVLVSFLSPEEKTIRVYLSMTDPVFGKRQQTSNTFLRSTTVTISNPAQGSRVIPYDPNYFGNNVLFSIPSFMYPIIPGQRYTITASFGSRVAYGSCTIPVGLPLVDNAEYVKFKDEDGEKDRLKTTWIDIPGQENYYRLFVNSFFVENTDTILLELGNHLYDDKGNDGGVFIDKFDNTFVENAGLLLLNTDYAYYEYHRRRDLNDGGGDNPFIEPLQQYNNIEGGLGCIGSYRKSLYALISPPRKPSWQWW